MSVRIGAARALGNIEDPRAASILLAAWSESDTEVIAGAYSFFIRRGEPDSEDALIAALNRFGNSDMATDFLNCGNSKLGQAGSKWAGRHGFQMTRVPGGGGSVQWGSSR